MVYALTYTTVKNSIDFAKSFQRKNLIILDFYPNGSTSSEVQHRILRSEIRPLLVTGNMLAAT